MTNEEHIEELLVEASAHGLRTEVIEEAKKIMLEQPKIDKYLAYELAFNKWVK